MTITTSVTIDASRERVWNVITDFDNAEENIASVLDLQVLNKPETGWIGFKWKETRKMFGKEAEETMTISQCVEGQWYETTANNHGTVYTSRLEITEISSEQCSLTMSFGHKPDTVAAKIMSVFSFAFTGAIKKAFQADLRDIKQVAETG